MEENKDISQNNYNSKLKHTRDCLQTQDSANSCYCSGNHRRSIQPQQQKSKECGCNNNVISSIPKDVTGALININKNLAKDANTMNNRIPSNASSRLKNMHSTTKQTKKKLVNNYCKGNNPSTNQFSQRKPIKIDRSVLKTNTSNIENKKSIKK